MTAAGPDVVLHSLEHLAVPRVADAWGLWSCAPDGSGRRVNGSATVSPPARVPLGDGVWAADGRGDWSQCAGEEPPAGCRAVALGLLDPPFWVVFERTEARPAYDGADVAWLRHAVSLAAATLASARQVKSALEARATGDAAAHRWAAIARMTGLLARSLGVRATLEAVLAGVVPYLADWAIVDAIDSTGTPHRLGRHAQEEPGEVVAGLKGFPFGDMRLSEGLRSLPANGIVTARFDPDTANAMVPEADRAAVARLAPRSLLVLPLSFGDRVGGALTIATSSSGQEYGTVDVDLFRQIARQAGLALTNATILTETRNARLEREEVLAIVSHDLKNPLNVLGFASTLLLTPGIPEARKLQQIEIIERAVRQMDELINNLLDAARIDAGRFSVQPRPLDPAGLVRESLQQIRPIAEKEGVQLGTDLDPDLPQITADRERLLRVFGNLLANAISFTPRGGAIMLAAKAVPGFVEFEVRDTGPGIEPEALANIFDRYFQARRQGRAGTGLGLTIVRGIVHAHGGSVEVESELGSGTTFRFSIPAAIRHDPGVHPSNQKDEGHGDGAQDDP